MYRSDFINMLYFSYRLEGMYFLKQLQNNVYKITLKFYCQLTNKHDAVEYIPKCQCRLHYISDPQ